MNIRREEFNTGSDNNCGRQEVPEKRNSQNIWENKYVGSESP